MNLSVCVPFARRVALARSYFAQLASLVLRRHNSGLGIARTQSVTITKPRTTNGVSGSNHSMEVTVGRQSQKVVESNERSTPTTVAINHTILSANWDCSTHETLIVSRTANAGQLLCAVLSFPLNCSRRRNYHAERKTHRVRGSHTHQPNEITPLAQRTRRRAHRNRRGHRPHRQPVAFS